MSYPQVGPVRFETADGLPIDTLRCTRHELLRPFQLLYHGLMYVQNRQEADAWIYRAAAEVRAVGHDRSDPSLEPLDG